jgi:D-alanyl-D-alanine carboxypeptidase
MDAHHVMFSGSIGKTYAVALLMQLVDEGKMNLEDRYIDYFQDSSWLQNLPNINAINIKMLLQHTSGLPRYVMKPEIWSALKNDPDKVWTYKERMSYIFNDEPVHEAGKGWGYSDTGYILLGMLIEKITGQPYYEAASDRILTELNLDETYPSLKRNMFNLTQGYSRLPEFFQIPEKVVTDGKYCFNPQLEWTGGGFASTTSDLAQWAEAYYKGKLFSDSLLQKVITPSEQGFLIQEGLSYGMGTFIFDTEYGKAYAHSGFVPGFLSMFAYYPDPGISMALQINCDYASQSLNLIDMLNLVISNNRFRLPPGHHNP